MTSCCSSDNDLETLKPTLPAPITTIFIFSSRLRPIHSTDGLSLFDANALMCEIQSSVSNLIKN
jgi:hypothetical protein